MKTLADFARRFSLIAICGVAVGCSELRARQRAREGNERFREGDYAAAVSAYSQSEALHPLAVVAFNKGLACRQLMIPGAKSAANDRAVDCALRAFTRLKELDPKDSRADQLYQQTLFDADRFEPLAKLYLGQLEKQPNDPAALNALVQVYSRWGRWDEALHWMIERGEREPKDAEAQYAIGVFVYNRLFEKGGGAEKSTFDPRPVPGAEPKVPPPFGPGDITGQERVTLAERGIEHAKRAIALRPQYADALTYLGLLYRQKSFALFDRPEEWQAAVDTAEQYRKQAAALHAQHPAPPRP